MERKYSDQDIALRAAGIQVPDGSGSFGLSLSRAILERSGKNFDPPNNGGTELQPYGLWLGGGGGSESAILPNEFKAVRGLADLSRGIVFDDGFTPKPYLVTFPSYPVTSFVVPGDTVPNGPLFSGDPSTAWAIETYMEYGNPPVIRAIPGFAGAKIVPRFGWGCVLDGNSALALNDSVIEITPGAYAPRYFNDVDTPNPHDLRGTFTYKVYPDPYFGYDPATDTRKLAITVTIA